MHRQARRTISFAHLELGRGPTLLERPSSQRDGGYLPPEEQGPAHSLARELCLRLILIGRPACLPGQAALFSPRGRRPAFFQNYLFGSIVIVRASARDGAEGRRDSRTNCPLSRDRPLMSSDGGNETSATEDDDWRAQMVDQPATSITNGYS